MYWTLSKQESTSVPTNVEFTWESASIQGITFGPTSSSPSVVSFSKQRLASVRPPPLSGGSQRRSRIPRWLHVGRKAS